MDPPNNDESSRLVAPRPLFMSEEERQDYEDMWKFIRDHEQDVPQRVYCRFFNFSNRDVDVIWCRGENEEDRIYSTIPPRRYFEIFTFESHPWIFRATEDGERMEILTTGQKVHYPFDTVSKIVSTSKGPVKMQAVKICSPSVEGTSLKHLCIRQMSCLFSTDYVSKLQLPASVLAEILEYYINKISYVHALSPSQQNVPEKKPAAKTVEYLRQLLDDLESQHCDLDLREKLRENMRLFTKIISNTSDASVASAPSTSKNLVEEAARKRPLNESPDNETNNQTDTQDAPSTMKLSKSS